MVGQFKILNTLLNVEEVVELVVALSGEFLFVQAIRVITKTHMRVRR